MLGFDHPRDAQINLRELVDRDLIGDRFILQRLVAVVELTRDIVHRVGRSQFLAFFNHLL